MKYDYIYQVIIFIASKFIMSSLLFNLKMYNVIIFIGKNMSI